MKNTALKSLLVIPRGSQQTIVVTEIKNATIRLEEGAKLTFVLWAVEGWEGLAKLNFEFVGRESELQFLGFVIGKEQHRFQFETVSRHLVPQTKAHYLLRAAMFDHAVVDYKGTIIIEKPAQLTDTYLAHHTLLLSDFARARTIPALEIEADDVKAGHAATIGKMDEEVMFYLQSRGIEPKVAELMLIHGFFEQELMMIGDEKIRDALRRALVSYLPQNEL